LLALGVLASLAIKRVNQDELRLSTAVETKHPKVRAFLVPDTKHTSPFVSYRDIVGSFEVHKTGAGEMFKFVAYRNRVVVLPNLIRCRITDPDGGREAYSTHKKDFGE
jgi:hypothetical protein